VGGGESKHNLALVWGGSHYYLGFNPYHISNDIWVSADGFCFRVERVSGCQGADVITHWLFLSSSLPILSLSVPPV
jgi:hypothetical protein